MSETDSLGLQPLPSGNMYDPDTLAAVFEKRSYRAAALDRHELAAAYAQAAALYQIMIELRRLNRD